MALQTAVQGRAGEMRDRCLQRIQAIIKGQQRMLAKGDDDGLLLNRQDRRLGSSRPPRLVVHRASFLPSGDSLCVDPVPIGQDPQALLTILYCSTYRLIPTARFSDSRGIPKSVMS